MNGSLLIVEDEEKLVRLLADYLEQSGYLVTCLADGGQVIPWVRANSPDLILLDISLAGEIDGLEVSRRLRADADFNKTVIVALTAHAMNEDRQMTLAGGCDDYWTKPIIDLVKFREDVATIIKDGRNSGYKESGA